MFLWGLGSAESIVPATQTEGHYLQGLLTTSTRDMEGQDCVGSCETHLEMRRPCLLSLNAGQQLAVSQLPLSPRLREACLSEEARDRQASCPAAHPLVAHAFSAPGTAPRTACPCVLPTEARALRWPFSPELGLELGRRGGPCQGRCSAASITPPANSAGRPTPCPASSSGTPLSAFDRLPQPCHRSSAVSQSSGTPGDRTGTTVTRTPCVRLELHSGSFCHSHTPPCS